MIDALTPAGPFDQRERSLLQRVLTFLDLAPDLQEVTLQLIERLALLARLVDSYPSLLEPSTLAGHCRDGETLIAELIDRGPLLSPLRLPVKAQLSRNYVIAKTQAWRAIDLVVRDLDDEEGAVLHVELRREIRESVFTLLIAEVLLDIVTEEDSTPEEKRRSGEMLVQLWDTSIHKEVGAFCPELEAAWAARNRLVVAYGTLMGSTEILRLQASLKDTSFMDLFCGDDASEELRMAFEEFLFGLSYEQLTDLRRAMRAEGRHTVDRQWVARRLGTEPSRLHSGAHEPEAMFESYQRRQVAALFRRIRGRPGPRRTAEAILLLDYLARREARAESVDSAAGLILSEEPASG